MEISKQYNGTITGENNFEFNGAQYPHHVRLSQLCQHSLWTVKMIPVIGMM
jgi:hypothetical protein